MRIDNFNNLDNYEKFKFLENLRTIILSDITTKFQASCKGDVKSMLALRSAVSGFDELNGSQIAVIGLNA